MIAKVVRGTDARRLLQYLYGPGRANEHTDPHLVASFGDPAELEPTHGPDGKPDLHRLSGLLAQPLAAALGPRMDKPVWHCSVRAAPGDRMLSDAEWAEVAALIMNQTGLASSDDDLGVRWIAVRHAADHIHIVATLARQDGRRPKIWNDFYRVREACQKAEQTFGLRQTPPADRTAGKRPTRAESEQATKRGWSEPPRVTLRREVSQAAAAASSEREFFTLLRESGVLVRLRFSTKNPGEVTGYAVGLAHHTNQDGGVVWYGGGKLVVDLSLPKLRKRWAPRSAAGQQRRHDPFRAPGGSTAYEHAAQGADAAAQHIRGCSVSDPGQAADAAWATADLLRIAARVLRNPTLWHMADAYDRAARTPYGRIPRCSAAGERLRLTARLLWTMRSTPGSSDQLADLILNLLVLVESVAELHAMQRHSAQAAAAHRAAGRLHILYRGFDGPQETAHNYPRQGVPTRAPDLARQDIPADLTLIDLVQRPPRPPAPPPRQQPRPRVRHGP